MYSRDSPLLSGIFLRVVVVFFSYFDHFHRIFDHKHVKVCLKKLGMETKTITTR